MPDGSTPLVDAVSRRELKWAAIFPSGISMVSVPDTALPEVMGPEEFRARLDVWRDAA
ncbi:MAG: hypothetical protein HUJ27_15145 [Rhodobacteraceae bacterium]|nr:hypothetical protein [Paracoccaceae bacterium]